jgi:hypothetical protein
MVKGPKTPKTPSSGKKTKQPTLSIQVPTPAPPMEELSGLALVDIATTAGRTAKETIKVTKTKDVPASVTPIASVASQAASDRLTVIQKTTEGSNQEIHELGRQILSLTKELSDLKGVIKEGNEVMNLFRTETTRSLDSLTSLVGGLTTRPIPIEASARPFSYIVDEKKIVKKKSRDSSDNENLDVRPTFLKSLGREEIPSHIKVADKGKLKEELEGMISVEGAAKGIKNPRIVTVRPPTPSIAPVAAVKKSKARDLY